MEINLVSDTVTKPTQEMLNAMFTAKVGDDVYKQDPTVNALEEKVAAMFGMAAVTTKSGSSIKLVSTESVIEAGMVFSVDVFVYASTPINAVDIGVTFPTEQIEVLGIDKGESVITLWTSEPHVEKNVVVLQGGTYKKGFIGEHKIATINVKAKSTGQAEFLVGSVNLLAGDGKGTAVVADASKAVVTTNIVARGESPAAGLEAKATFVLVTDIDGDNEITLRDISAFMANWVNRGTLYDFNNDGAMTFRDFSIILSDFFSQRK